MEEHFKLIDKPTFFGAVILLISVVIPLALFPDEGAHYIAIAKTFMTDTMGVLYLALGLAAVLFMTYVVFSDIGQIKLGDADEKPEFSTASWAAMLFCGGIGASILYWAALNGPITIRHHLSSWSRAVKKRFVGLRPMAFSIGAQLHGVSI